MPQQDDSEEFALGVLKFLGGLLFALIGGIIALFVTSQRHNEQQKSANLLTPTPPSNSTSPNGIVRPIEFFFAALGVGLLYAGATGMAYQSNGILALVGILFLVSAVWVYKNNQALPSEDTPPSPDSPSETPTESPVPKIHARKYIIQLPRTTVWKPDPALALMDNLLTVFGNLVFEIVADHQSIDWQIIDIGGTIAPEAIQEAVRTIFPEVDINVAPSLIEAPPIPFHRCVMCFEHAAHFVRPMAYVTDVKGVDPLAGMTQVMDSLNAGERITYMVNVVGTSPEFDAEGRRQISNYTVHPLQFFSAEGIGDAAVKWLTNQKVAPKYVPEIQRVMEDKLFRMLYQTALLVQIDTPDPDRIITLCALIEGQILQMKRDPYNALLVVPDSLDSVHITSDVQVIPTSSYGVFTSWMKDTSNQKATMRKATRLVLEARELALLWHLPHIGFAARHIHWMQTRQVDAPTPVMSSQDGIQLGLGVERGKRVPVYLKPEDRSSHIWILGKTGFGKSSLMYQMITRDIAAGHGVAVLDPHGTLIQDILRCGIPAYREQDLVVLDLADTEYPPPLNLLRGNLEYVRIGQITSIIERLFPDTLELARLSRYLRASLTLVNADPEATLLDVIQVFRDVTYRERLMAATTDDDLLLTWQEYSKMKEGEQARILDPILSRLNPFISNPLIRPVLCHPDTVDFRTLIRQGKILLISLKMDALQVPELEQNILGALLLSQLQAAGMKDRSARFYIYLDEVQRFVTSSLADLFSASRGFGLSLTVAHQYLYQLTNDNMDAVLGNAGMSVLFQLGTKDAHALQSLVAPEFRDNDLENLNKFQAVVKMLSGEHTQPPFTLYTLPPPTAQERETGKAREVLLRQRSREQWTPKTTQEVLAWLKQRRRGSGPDNQTQFMDKGS